MYRQMKRPAENAGLLSFLDWLSDHGPKARLKAVRFAGLEDDDFGVRRNLARVLHELVRRLLEQRERHVMLRQRDLRLDQAQRMRRLEWIHREMAADRQQHDVDRVE